MNWTLPDSCGDPCPAPVTPQPEGWVTSATHRHKGDLFLGLKSRSDPALQLLSTHAARWAETREPNVPTLEEEPPALCWCWICWHKDARLGARSGTGRFSPGIIAGGVPNSKVQ